MLYAMEYYDEDREAFERFINETSKEKATVEISETNGDTTIFNIDV